MIRKPEQETSVKSDGGEHGVKKVNFWPTDVLQQRTIQFPYKTIKSCVDCTWG